MCEQLIPAGGAVLGDCGTIWSWDGECNSGDSPPGIHI